MRKLKSVVFFICVISSITCSAMQEYSEADIQYTAKLYKISPAEVRHRLSMGNAPSLSTVNQQPESKQKIEASKVLNGVIYLKINGKWYSNANNNPGASRPAAWSFYDVCTAKDENIRGWCNFYFIGYYDGLFAADRIAIPKNEFLHPIDVEYSFLKNLNDHPNYAIRDFNDVVLNSLVENGFATMKKKNVSWTDKLQKIFQILKG
jgi:hypothetical protein